MPAAWACFLLSGAFLVQLGTYTIQEIHRTFKTPSLAELEEALGARLLARKINADLGFGLRRGDVKGEVRRVRLPDSWQEGSSAGRPPAKLFVFVDGRPASFFPFDPEASGPQVPYAYYLRGRARQVHIVCGEDLPCLKATLVRHDTLAAAALSGRRLLRAPSALASLLLATGLFAFAVLLSARSWSPVWRILALTAASALTAFWLLLGLHASPSAPVLLVLQATAAGAKGWLSLGKAVCTATLSWFRLASYPGGRGARVARFALLCAVSVGVALPYVALAQRFYPGESDDSLRYLYAAARLLSGGSLTRALFDPSAWVYSSVYPVGIAALSRVTDAHPMEVYRWLGFAGAALLPLSLGLFVWFVTGRLGAALLACPIAAFWGGLAGYLWLSAEAIPFRLEHGRWPLIETDYYEARFLGEFAGPHADVAAYLCSVPFYARELGLVVLWPGLGVVFGVARPGVGRIAAFAACALLATAVYPYYAPAGLLALAVIAVREALGRRDKAGWAISAAYLLLSFAAAFAVNDLLIRAYQKVSLFEYLSRALRGSLVSATPALDFRPERLLGGHFFGIAAIVAAWRLGARIEGRPLPPWGRWPGRALLFTGLAATLLAGAASSLLPRDNSSVTLFRWIVPWRTLVLPVLVSSVALAVEWSAVRWWSTGRRRLILPLMMVPCLSPAVWHVNAWVLLDAPWRQGSGSHLYETFAGHGSSVLGRVRLRGPLLIEGPAAAADYAQAAFGVAAFAAQPAGRPASGSHPLFSSGQEGELFSKISRGEIGDVVAERGGEFAVRMERSRRLSRIAAFGPYVALRQEKR